MGINIDMKIKEIVKEAHHSIIDTRPIGDWILDVDSHFMASMADRSDILNMMDVISIISYACIYSEELKNVVRGTGVFVQDTNSKISIYLHRYKNQPNRLRLETVLTPEMKPKEPVIRIAVPVSDNRMSKKDMDVMANMRKHTQEFGRDSVSQEIERNTNLMKGMNRHDRRAFKKMIKKV